MAHRRTPLRLLALLLALPASALAQPGEPPPPEGSALVVGKADRYTGGFGHTLRGTTLQVPFSVGFRAEDVGGFLVDRYRTRFDPSAAIDVQARVGLRFNTRRAILPFNVALEYEHDVIAGPVVGDPALAGVGLPNAEEMQHQLRKAYGRVSLGYYAHVIGGFMTSHWGLGLVANDGDHGWSPGSAAFADPRGGDRVLRLMLASGPLSRFGLQAAVGFDWVQKDDAMLEGDEARQVVASFMIGAGLPTRLGFYGVYRRQESEAGGELDVAVVDLYFATQHRLRGRIGLSFELESALIVGSTSLGAAVDFRRRDVLQLGVALRGALELGRAGLTLDLLYASGDQNLDDSQQNNFKADPNFELGLLTYRYLYAAHSGRAVAVASDPSLSGRPVADLERFPSRGAATNTVAIFPRVWWRPARGLELYGGPLFAFAAAPVVDALATKEAGGAPRNAFAAESGGYLGTEVDLGVRFRMLLGGTELTVGGEAGLLLPGSAFQQRGGQQLDAIAGGRGLLRYRF